MTTSTNLTTAEITHRNIQLGIVFTEGIIAGTVTDDVPKGVNLILLPKDDPDMIEANIEIGIDAIRRGDSVYFRYV